SQVIDIQFKAALLDLAPVIKDASGLLGGLSHAVAQVHDALASPENKSDEGLRKWIEGIKEQISDTEKMIATMKSNDANSWFSGASDWQIANQEKYLETKRQELDLSQKILATRNADSWERGTKLTERAFTTDDDDKKPKTEEALRALSQLQKTYYAESKQTMQLIWQQDEEELRRFEKMLNDKKISQEEFEKARILIMNTTAVRVKNLLDEETKQIKAISGLIEKDLESAFSQFVNKGKVNWQQLAHTMLADLASLEFKMLVMQPLFGGKAQAGGGFGASSTSSQGLIGSAASGFQPFAWLSSKLFHEGGVVGVDGVERMVSSAVFAGAARYHEGGIAGLAPDEVPAILQQGETVIPKGGSAGGHSFNFSIDARGAEIGVETKINQALARATPQIVKHAVAAVEATANKRPGYLSK
ncbi:MAG: phage tail tape measure C-terminal domain-containing protein, partial [Rhodomicrobium sp.]